MTVYGFIHGDVTKLLAPIDGNLDFCGIKNGDTANDDLTDYPYLYIGNLEAGLESVAAGAATGNALSGVAKALKTAVCVKTCPKTYGHTSIVECKKGT